MAAGSGGSWSNMTTDEKLDTIHDLFVEWEAWGKRVRHDLIALNAVGGYPLPAGWTGDVEQATAEERGKPKEKEEKS